jgi:hypothetical protein
VPLHCEHLHFKHLVGKKGQKKVNPNMMLKTLMPFYKQQVWMGGEKLGGDKS